MPKHSLPRKSTNIDMTAMCDVAFLLLTFFMLATKFKPAEAKPVTPPSSVSTQPIPDKDAFIVSIDDEGKVYVMLGADNKKQAVLENINTQRQLGLTPAQIAKLAKADFYAVPHEKLAEFADLTKEQAKDVKVPGIPVMDSTNNQLYDYVYGAIAANEGKQWNWIIKGDQKSKYIVFKRVLDAFERLNAHKFKMITKMEGVPVGTELYYLRNAGKDASQAE